MTKDLLTKYAEGLACVRFDMRNQYDVRLYKKHHWFVMKKRNQNTDTKDKGRKHSIKFDRCRSVQIINGYMNCSCGDTQQYLMPCRHMCAVIKEKEYLVPQLYHVRWYKTFEYYYLQEFSKNMIPTLNQKLQNIQDHSINNDFSKINGQYKGVYCLGTKFYEDIERNYKFSNDEVFQLMNSVKTTSLKMAVVKGSITAPNDLSLENNSGESIVEDSNLFSKTNNTLDDFGVSSQTDFQFSQQRENMVEDETNNELMLHGSTTSFKDAEALFKEVYYDCNNHNEVSQLMQCIRNYGNTLQARNNNTMKEVEKGGMIMYGTNITSKRHIPRCRSYSERRLKKRRGKNK